MNTTKKYSSTRSSLLISLCLTFYIILCVFSNISTNVLAQQSNNSNELSSSSSPSGIVSEWTSLTNLMSFVQQGLQPVPRKNVPCNIAKWEMENELTSLIQFSQTLQCRNDNECIFVSLATPFEPNGCTSPLHIMLSRNHDEFNKYYSGLTLAKDEYNEFTNSCSAFINKKMDDNNNVVVEPCPLVESYCNTNTNRCDQRSYNIEQFNTQSTADQIMCLIEQQGIYSFLIDPFNIINNNNIQQSEQYEQMLINTTDAIGLIFEDIFPMQVLDKGSFFNRLIETLLPTPYESSRPLLKVVYMMIVEEIYKAFYTALLLNDNNNNNNNNTDVDLTTVPSIIAPLLTDEEKIILNNLPNNIESLKELNTVIMTLVQSGRKMTIKDFCGRESNIHFTKMPPPAMNSGGNGLPL